MREFVHEPMKIVSGRMSRIGVPGARSMYASARAAASRFDGSSNASGSGTASSIVTDCAGFVPQLTYGLSSAASISTSRVERRAGVGRQGAPVVERGFPVGAARRVRAPLDVGERRVVGRDHAGARAGLDRHVADRHAALHRQRADRRPAVLDHVADAAARADAVDDRRGSTSFADTPAGSSPSTVTAIVSGGVLRQRLGRRARARPRSCRCRTRARRTRRASRCASRRRRSSCRAGCSPCSGPITCTMPWPAAPHG